MVSAAREEQEVLSHRGHANRFCRASAAAGDRRREGSGPTTMEEERARVVP